MAEKVRSSETSSSILPGQVRRAIEWGADNLFLCWAWVVVVMFVLTCLSIPLGNFSVLFDGYFADGAHVDLGTVQAKEVGYISAINWSVYSIVVLPVMMICCLRIWADMPATLRDISGAGMIRDGNFKRVDESALTAAWTRSYKQANAIFFVIFFCVFVFAMWDWWTSVATPILNRRVLNGVVLTDPVFEFDWSIACLYRSSQIACGPLLAFGIVAYVLIAGLGTSIAFATCICALFYVTFVCGFAGNKRRGWVLVAVPSRDGDHRCGFGNFGRFFTALVGLSIGVVVGSLLMIIQNNYLRDGDSKNVFDFIFGDAATMVASIQGATLSQLLEFSWLKWLFAPASVMLGNPDTGIGILLFTLTAVVVVGMSWGLLRSAAHAARENSLAHVRVLAQESGLSEKTVRRHLQEMDFWPIGWLKLNQLIILMIGSIAAIMSYRLLLLPVGWLALQGAQQIVQLWKGVKPAKPHVPRARPRDSHSDDK